MYSVFGYSEGDRIGGSYELLDKDYCETHSPAPPQEPVGPTGVRACYHRFWRLQACAWQQLVAKY